MSLVVFDRFHAEVRSHDGGITGSVTIDPESRVATLHFEFAPGRCSPRALREVVAAIFGIPALAACRTLQAALPLGSYDLVSDLGDRLADVRTRAAGATCLLDATVVS